MNPDQPTVCIVDGCGRPAQRVGLCWGHVKRRGRRMRIFTRLECPPPPSEALVEAAVALALVDDSPSFDRAFDQAWERLKAAALRFARHTQPETGQGGTLAPGGRESPSKYGP